MDGQRELLEQKLDQLLKEAAEVSVALDRKDGIFRGVPHYSVIEQRAHQLGRQLSCQIQARGMAEVATSQPSVAPCPTCGTRCELTTDTRDVTSVDGTVPLPEPKGDCPSCRRSFFPAAADDGV